MSQSRIFIANSAITHGDYVIRDNQCHYLVTVMRKKINDVVLIFNGKDGEWEAKITAIGRKELVLHCYHQTRQQPISTRKVSLGFALVKNDNNHFIIQKATELGIDTMLPILTTYTVVRNCNTEKYELIAREAAEQSARLTVPVIKTIQKLYEMTFEGFDIILFCNETDKEHYVLDVLHDIKNFNNILLLIGPEGGFCQNERQWIASLTNMRSLCLSKSILRSETAAISAISILQATLL